MASDRIVSKPGFKLIIRSGTVTNKLKTEILEGLKEVSANYKTAVQKNLELDDHTLAELRQLGHPYAVGKSANIPHDDRMVHEQTGELHDSIEAGAPTAETSRRFSVYVTSNSPKAAYLIYGTQNMRPRRFHEKAFQDIKAKYWEPILSRLKKFSFRIEVGREK